MITMDWFPWLFGPTLDIPYIPHIPPTTLDGRPPPDEVDVALIDLTYLFIANEQNCSECGHLLGRGLRVRHASAAAPPRWPVWIDTRCWGWLRHAYIASVTRPFKDLMLGDLHLRPDVSRPTNTKDTT